MRTYVCMLAFFLVNACAIGQSNIIKAVVVDNNGDSIYGSIDYRNWKNNPQTITFINSANEKKVLDPSSIRGFYVPGATEAYTSFLVEIDRITSDQDQAINNRFIDSSPLIKRVFLLQLMLHPVLSLYEFNSDHKEHFYYKKGGEEPTELVHHYLFDESGSRVKEILTYQEQLSGLFASCPDVAGRSATIKFRKKDIQDIFLKYLQCIAPGSGVDVKKKDISTFQFGIVAGVMLNTFKFQGEHQIANDNYSTTLSPVFGVSFDAGLSRNRNKWHILNQLIYKSYKTSSSFTKPYGNGYTVTSDVDLNFSYVQINTLLRYILQPKGSLKPFINFGMGNAFIVSENANNSHNIYSFGNEENIKAIDRPRKYEFSPLGGVGVITQKIEVELRYGGNKKGFSPAFTLDVHPGSFQFIFTYRL